MRVFSPGGPRTAIGGKRISAAIEKKVVYAWKKKNRFPPSTHAAQRCLLKKKNKTIGVGQKKTWFWGTQLF